MASSYPGAYDAFGNPTGANNLDDVVGGRTHSQMHADENDAIEAVQAALGLDPAGDYATVKARLDAIQARMFDVVTYGALVDGSTNDTAAWQAAVDACAAAGGGIVYSSKPGVSIISGALQDTSGANAQILLPSKHATDDEQIGIAIVGSFPAPSVMSVIGSTPTPDNHLVLKSTLASGTGSVIGARGPSGSYLDFSMIHVELRDLTVRTVSNPTLTAIDLSHVASAEVDGVVVDCGGYNVDAITQPTTATSYGLRMPGNNNGARSRLGRVDVIGFYTGYQFAEHTNGEDVNAWGCRVAAEFVASNHASVFQRFMAAHCTRGLKFVGGAHAVDVYQFDIEHVTVAETPSAPSWQETLYDIDDASNYGKGFVRWHAVLGNVGDHNSFTVNGATGFTTSRVGSAIGSGSGTTIYWKRDRVVAAAGNTILTLGATPVANSPMVWVNNVIKWPGTDYTISSNVITFGAGLSASDVVLVAYETTNSSAGSATLTSDAVDIVDNFNRTSSTNNLGSTSTGSKVWTQHNGTWGIIDGTKAYVSNGAGAGTCLASVDAGTATCTVSAVITGGGLTAGLLVRGDLSGNHYVAEVNVGGAGTPQIYKGTAGSYTVIATGASTTVASGSVLSVVLSGNTITVKDDGVTIVSVTDSTWSANTRHGMYIVSAAGVSSAVRIDDFSIQP